MGFKNIGDSRCQSCEKGYYLEGNECTPTPAGWASVPTLFLVTPEEPSPASWLDDTVRFCNGDCLDGWRATVGGVDGGWQLSRTGGRDSHSVMVMTFAMQSPTGAVELIYDFSQSSPFSSLRLFVDDELVEVLSPMEAVSGVATISMTANYLNPQPLIRNVTFDFYVPAPLQSSQVLFLAIVFRCSSL